MSPTISPQGPPRIREYETIYILKPTVGRDPSTELAKRVQEVFARSGATLKKVENWGRRRLAYRVQRQSHGIYMYVKYTGSGQTVSELERMLRYSDDVMKLQTVRTADVVEATEIDPKEVVFEHFDATNAPPLEEESLARQLGLEGRSYRDHNMDRDDREADLEEMDTGEDEPTLVRAGAAKEEK